MTKVLIKGRKTAGIGKVGISITFSEIIFISVECVVIDLSDDRPTMSLW